MNNRRITAIAWFLVACSICAGTGLAQEVRLRAGDAIKLEVPQREDLTRLLAVDRRGNVNIPIVGAIPVEGLTIEEARAALLRGLQDVYPSVRSIAISLIGAETRTYIYVQGQVTRPDKYDLALASTMWDAIREAGGVTLAASLEAVRLIRAEGDSTTTTIVNVQRALDAGDLSLLPALKPGDTVIVPERTAAARASADAVIVVGAVASPAPYHMSGDKRLVDAILAAGGWADFAALDKVKIIRPLPGGGILTMRVNLKRYLETGDVRYNPPVFPNDTVSVPRKSSILTIFTDPRFLLGIITTVATVTAIIVVQR